ncbi:MAG: electron transfer flavoprotein subunit beta/FixA family protein [Endomicrobiales bacterium]
MHIVVCLKQVPDTTDVKIDRETNTLIRDGVASIANPFDLNAVETALEIKATCGAKVTVISMGPPQTKEALRRAVAMGADQAILLSDRSFAGADTLATSYTLSMAIAQLRESEGLDLVICGKQAIDGDTAQVGPGIATRLGLTQLTYVVKVRSIDPGEGTIVVERKLEDGIEIVRGRLPALLTVVREINKTRYPALPELIQSLTYEPAVWNKASFAADASKLGLEGSPTAVETIFTPPLRGGGSMLFHGQDGFEQALGAVIAKMKIVVEENRKNGCE